VAEARGPARPVDRPRGAVRESVRAYGLVVGMWVRSTWAYRTSFLLTLVGSLVVTVLDFVTIALMFSHIHVLGGFTLP
jgi:viologen exporter family transport system permease protein